MGDVTETGDGTHTDVERRRIWRTPRVLLALVVLAAAVVVAAVNVPVLVNRDAEAQRLRRDGVAVRATVVWWDPIGGRQHREARSLVRVAYEFQDRSYESTVYCPDSTCTPPSVIELWVDPQRPERFATEHGEINDGVIPHGRIRLISFLVSAALVVTVLVLISVVRERRRPARRRLARPPAQPAPGDEEVDRPRRRRLRTGARRWRRRS